MSIVVLYVTIPLEILITLAGPFALGWWLARRYHVSWSLFGIGALIFAGSQVVHLPLLGGLTALFQQPWMPKPAEAGRLLFNACVLGLAAGFSEELARYAGYRWLARTARSWREALMLGAGHGGLESVVFVGLPVAITFIAMAANRPLNLSGLGAASAQIAAYWSQPAYLPLLGALERAFALADQTALSVLVLQVFVRGKPLYLLAAIGWHALLDAAAVYAANFWTPPAVEGLVGLMALVSLGVIWYYRPRVVGAASAAMTM